MKLVRVAQGNIAKSCPLDGVTITEVRMKDAYSTLAITLMDHAGHVLVFERGGYSDDVMMLVKAPPDQVKRYIVEGSVAAGVRVREQFDSRPEALTRKEELLRAHGQDTHLDVNEVMVEVPE